MKKIVVAFLSVLLILSLSLGIAGCNYNIGPGKFEFKGVHVADAAGNYRDLHVVSWRDDDVGIEVKTEEEGSLFLSEGTYILYEHECPICATAFYRESEFIPGP